MNTDEKLDLILEKIKKIERTVNPPLWKILLEWILSHFLVFIFLIFIAIVAWKTWGIVNDLLDFTDSVKDKVGQFGEWSSEKLDKVKFWK